jgi:AraC-like DNA-binding protein
MADVATPVQDFPMRKLVLAPPAALRPYIQQFLVVEYTSDHSNTLLPNAGMVAAFRFKGQCLVNETKAPSAAMTGLCDKARNLAHAGNCANVIAIFTPTGAAAFLREPLEEIFNTTVSLEYQVCRSYLDLFEEKLLESSHHDERVQVVGEFLSSQLRARTVDPLVAAAIDCIQKTRGALRIERLARHTGLSQSALERRFRREVGASPKKVAALVRLRHAMRLRRAGASLTEVAYAAGYSDQPHFIRDFKRFAGQTPEAFFQTVTAFC